MAGDEALLPKSIWHTLASSHKHNSSMVMVKEKLTNIMKLYGTEFIEELKLLFHGAKLHSSLHQNESSWISPSRLFNFCKVDQDALYREKAAAVYSMAPVAIIVIIILSFLKRRKFKHPECLGGRPALLYPVNMIEEQTTRLSFIAAFCISALQIYDLLMGEDPIEHVLKNHSLMFKPPVKLFSCFLLGFVFYPIFAALSSKQWVGYLVGAIYSTAHAGTQLLWLPVLQDGILVLNYRSMIPVNLALSMVRLVYFDGSFLDYFASKLIDNVNPESKEYQQAYQMFFIFSVFYSGSATEMAVEMQYWINLLQACFYASLAISLLLIVISKLSFCKTYKCHLTKVFKGDHRIFGEEKKAVDGIVISMCKFVGFEVGYTTWGFAIQVLCSFILFAFVASMCTVAVRYHYWKLLLGPIKQYGPFLVTIYVLRAIQSILVRHLFLQKVDGAICLAFDNRRAFFIFQYFMVFLNAVLGIFSCLRRLLSGLVLGIWIIPRLDICAMPKVFDRFDKGHTSYLNLLRVENYQRNPILLSFIQILHECANERRQKPRFLPFSMSRILLQSDINIFCCCGDKHEEYAQVIEARRNQSESNMTNAMSMVKRRQDTVLRKKQIKMKWLVLYTLVSNPSIAYQRKRQMKTSTEAPLSPTSDATTSSGGSFSSRMSSIIRSFY